jgi:glycosyl transferase family 25
VHVVFLINLESAVERRLAMTRQLRALGIEAERIGVDLRAATRPQIEARAEALFPQLRFDLERLSGAEVGCWLSHLSAWRSALERGHRACPVVEDDLALAPHFGAAIDALRGPHQFDLVYLGTSSRNLSTRRASMIGPVCVHCPVGVIFNTWGYVVSTEYIERFFGAGSRSIKLPIDHFLGGRAPWARPRIAVLRPAAVTEDVSLGHRSQIGPFTRRLDRSRLLQDLRRRLLLSPLGNLYYETVYRLL